MAAQMTAPNPRGGPDNPCCRLQNLRPAANRKNEEHNYMLALDAVEDRCGNPARLQFMG